MNPRGTRLANQFKTETKIRDEFFAENDPKKKDELGRQLLEQERVTERLAQPCIDERFQSCYPKLRPQIEKADLEKMFAAFTKDPHFRYPSGGGGACHLRAEALAYHLTEAGYAVNIIRIEHSPTLIAMDRDRNNQLSGGYYDYHGYHTLVQIMVKEGQAEVPYLLDPQFMNSPLPW